MRRCVHVVLAALLCAGVAGCGSSGDDAADDAGGAGSEETPLLVADVQRSTLFDTRRELGLSLATTGDADVGLETIQLVTPLFEPVAPTARDTTLDAGGRALVMPLPYGTAACDGGSAGGDIGDSGDGDLVLAAVVDGVEVRVPVTEHPEGMLAALHERECAAAAVLDAGGRALVMPLPYGTAACDGGSAGGETDANGDGDLTLAAVVDGVEVRVPVTEHPEGMLAALHERECAAAAVLDDVDLALDGTWTVADPYTATGRLTATQRTAGVEVEVDEMLGNVIFGVTTATTAPVLTVDDAQPTASVEVTVSSARCDPHALTEYKRTFVFVVVVALGDDEPVRVDVRAEGAAHDALGQILTSCVA